MGRTKNIVRNIIWGYIYKIITLVMPFIIRTVIIRILGSEYLGLNSLFVSILDILNLAELGFGSAMAYALYKPIAENNIEEISALMKLYRNVYRFVGILIFVIGICLLPFLNIFIGTEYPREINIYLLYLLYLSYTVIGYLMSAYKASLFEGYQRADISNKINSGILIIRYLVQIITLVFLKNYYIYIIMLPIFQILTNIIAIIILNKMFPNIKPKGKIDSNMKRNIRKKVTSLIGHKISDKALPSINNVIVSTFLGLNILACFDNYNYIVTAIGSMLIIIYNAGLAGIGNSIVLESVNKNYKDFCKISFINNWLVGWCSISLLLLFQPFINLWVGEVYKLSNLIVLLFVIYFYAFYIRRIVLTYKDALGMWDRDAMKPYIMIIVNILFSIILVKRIGLAGVLLSSIIVNIFIGMPWETYVLFKYYFGMDKIKHYFKYQLTSFLQIICVGIITTFITNLFIFELKIVELMIKAMIIVILPNILLLCINSNKNEYKECKKMIINILKLKKIRNVNKVDSIR